MSRFAKAYLIRAMILGALLILAGPQIAAAVDLIGYVNSENMNAAYNQNVLPAQLAMLDELRYFGLTAASNGTIVPLSGTMQPHLNNIAFIQQKIGELPVGQRPRLGITIGGAGQDAPFTTIASTVNSVSCNLCSTFAQNIKSLLDTTGTTGVDIDWETPNQGVETATSYPTMLQRIKQEVGTTRRVYAAIEPQVIFSNSAVTGPNAIDGISLMTYDLGWWANGPTDPNRGEHSLQEYAVDSVKAWTDPIGSPVPANRTWAFSKWGNNTSIDKLGAGLPFYGRVIGTSAAPASSNNGYAYKDLVAGGTPDASGNYYTYLGQNMWTAGPSIASQRVQFANDRGLQHLIIWEITQDLNPSNSNSLLRTAFQKNQTLGGDFNFDRIVDASDLDIFRSTFGSTTDLRADGNGNGVIDASDYVVWRKQLPAAGAGALQNGSVPEPSAFASILLTLALLCSQRTGSVRLVLDA
jgi:GH18 family chitinase